MSSILVIDDEARIRRMLSIALTAEGFHCFEAEGVNEGIQLALKQRPSLIVLDLGLPDGDGEQVLVRLRESSRVPILVLSARHDEADKVRLLSRGANDYVVKPFGINELIARIRVLLRDMIPLLTESAPLRECRDIRIDTDVHKVWRDSEEVSLAPKEFQLLELLMREPGKCVSQHQLLQAIWGQYHTEDGHYVRILVSQLRKKLGEDNGATYIETIPGRGYRFIQTDVEHE